MGNSAKNYLEKAKEAFSRQIPREDAKRIAKVATAIIVVVSLVMCFMILTAQSRVLGEWENGPAYDSEYSEPGYYYIEFRPDGECYVSFDIEDSILGWGTFGTWRVSSFDTSGINISVSTYRDTEPVLYHYNPFSNRVSCDSLKFKKVK